MRIKICGITNEEDAMKAVHYGAWAIGFVFDKRSPRYISPSRVRRIVEMLPPFVTPVGVFVNLNERAVRDICKFTRIHTVQFHGEETPMYCKKFSHFKIIKAFRVQDESSLDRLEKYKVDAYLFDAYQPDAHGGTGKTFNWDVLKGKNFEKPFILSGGLNAGNIIQARETVKPFAVDVSSGVERSPGLKDHRALKTFFDLARGI